MPTKTFFNLNEDKQLAVYNAALRLFAETSFDKVSIQSIVDEAHIPRGSFYQYFTDKEDLFLYLCQEIDRKALLATYQDDMNFMWNMLYLPNPKSRTTESWYCLVEDRLKEEMSDEEFHFMLNCPPAPENLQLLSTAGIIPALYSLLLRHIRNSGQINTPENEEILAFLMATLDMLCLEYSKLNNCEILEAVPATQKILLAFYHSIQKQENPFSGSFVSFHLMGNNGLNLTLFPKKYTTAQDVAVANTFPRREVIDLRAEGLQGTFSAHADVITHGMQKPSGSASSTEDQLTDSDSSTEPSLSLILEIGEKKEVSAFLDAGDITHPLGNSFTLIGTDCNGKKSVLVEDGVLQ